MKDKMVVGVMCVACYVMVLLPSAVGKESTSKPPDSTSKTEQVRGGTPVRTEADYWVPLENWLKAKGSPLSGKDAYEVGKQYGIDPDFLIAVTKAETQLCTVKQRGSQFNCGSVGSFDSTNTTFQATSYRHGFEQIAQTVNNPLLKRYWRVSELSRSHNPAQSPVYASSTRNWWVNVMATMNQLKGRNETDYAFRK